MIQKKKLTEFYVEQYARAAKKRPKKMTGTTEMLRKTDNLFRALNSARSSGMNVRTLEDYHRQLKNAAVFAHRKKKEEMSLRIKEEMIPRLVDLDLELLLQEQKDGINGEFLSYLRRTMPGAICQETLFTLYPRFRQHKVKDKILELVPARPELEFPEVRQMHRHFILHIGPTNSGKTFRSLERLKLAINGVYLGPLRLLALEVFEQMQKYKADLLFFQKLRSSLMMVYAEKVDFSKYEDGIRSLLNTFVTSEPVEIVVEPVAIHDKVAMEKQLEEVEGQKAKAAYIQTRIVSELESRRYEDPMLFKKFSERIRDTIAEYRKSRDENVYLASMKKMADDLRQGFTGHSYPSAIVNDSDAKAFYGVVSDTLKQHGGDDLEFDDAVGKLALDMKQAVQSLARVDWRTSTPIHKKMNQAVEDLLWDFCDEHGIDLPIDKMDLLIESTIKTAMSRY